MTGVSQSFAPVVSASGTLDEAFPDVDPNHEPFGSFVLLQVRIAKSTTGNKFKDAQGQEKELYLAEETRANIQANTQVAKVISHGPLAFCNRNTGQPWPEGAWAHPGTFVRIPKFGGERWEVKCKEGAILFVLLKDLELLGRIPRPLEAVAYV